MLFRPSYCAHCGESIERLYWTLLTSRRFCQVCETQFKGYDLAVRGVVTIGFLIGMLGFGSYLQSRPSQRSSLVAVKQQVRESRTQPAKKPANDNAQISSNQTELEVPSRKAAPPLSPPVQRAPAPPTVIRSVADPSYFCGAETKKGTPCSRRVKGNIRCYQHPGMPAMISPDKLKIN